LPEAALRTAAESLTHRWLAAPELRLAAKETKQIVIGSGLKGRLLRFYDTRMSVIIRIADIGVLRARAVETAGALNTSSTGTQWGGTVGGGVEYALNAHWSTKVDYLYYDLGTKQVGSTFTGGGAVIQFFDVSNTGNVVRAGLNYKF
jgi:opacity protein-like surface antigen